MLTTDAALYLPLSDQMLDTVLDDREPLEAVLTGLPVPQLAALVVVRCAAKLQGVRSFVPGRLPTATHESSRAAPTSS